MLCCAPGLPESAANFSIGVSSTLAVVAAENFATWKMNYYKGESLLHVAIVLTPVPPRSGNLRKELGMPEAYLYEEHTKTMNYAEFVNKELVPFNNMDN